MQNNRPQTPMGHLWNSIQSWLFPVLEDEIGALDEKHRHLLARHVNALGQDTRQRLTLARSIAVASDATVDDVDCVRVFD